MKMSLVLICILSTLVASGFTLTCNECLAEDEKSCKGISKECAPDSDACVARYESNSLSGKEVKVYNRTCGPRKLCSLKESFTSSEGVVKISSTCCFTSNCNPPTPVFPQTKTEKNGISCMQCQSPESKPCTSSTYRDCTGDEKNCVSLIFTQLSSTLGSASGCGTPALCNLNNLDPEQQIKFSCVSGSGSLHHSLLLIFVAMFLVKVIG